MRTLFIDPGALRHPVVLEQATLGPDGAGGFAESWTSVATAFAGIEPLVADARFDADQTLETVTHRVTLRFRDDLRSGMRLTVGGRRFAVLTVHDPDETRRFLVCRAREEGL